MVTASLRTGLPQSRDQSTARVLWGGLLLFSATLGRPDTRILVPGIIEGQPVQFAVDTGSAVPFCAPSSNQARLHLPQAEAVPSAFAQTSPFSSKSYPVALQVLGRHYSGVEVFLLKEMPRGLFEEFDALIGWPAIQDNVLHFYLERGVAEFVDPGAVPIQSRGWLTASVVSEASVLVLDFGSGSDPYPVLVDTGLDDAVHLGEEEWMQWTSANPKGGYTLEADYMPGQGASVRKQILAKEVRLGKLLLTHVMISEAGEEQRKAGEVKTRAVIGLAALSHLELYVDYPNRRALIRPILKPKGPITYNRLGAVFVPTEQISDRRTALVAPGSPAHEAGLRDGDVLLAIDKRNVSDIGPLFEFWRKPAGTSYMLYVKRGEQNLAVQVRLRDFLRAR